MRRLRAWLSRLGGLFNRRERERDLAAELDSHLEMLIEDNLRAGMTPEEARRQALLRFGGVEAVKESYRDRRGLPRLENLVHDVRYAGRTLARSPGFSLVVVVSLALGIGGNAAIFSVINAVMLRALALPRPEELAFVRIGAERSAQVSHAMFEDLRRALPAGGRAAAMSRVARMKAEVEGESGSIGAAVQLASGDYFATLEVGAALGRLFSPEDNRRAGGHPVAVLGHAFWRQRFAAAPDVLGREVVLNGTRFAVIGVAAEGFRGVWLESPVDVWAPAAMQASVRYAQNVGSVNSDTSRPWFHQRQIEWLELVVRTAAADRAAAAQALGRAFEDTIASLGEGSDFGRAKRRLLRQGPLKLEPFDRGFSNLRRRTAGPLAVLMGMVVLLLLIACANSANLLLARAAARRREIALRLSIGATRGRLVQQLLTESALLGLLAGAAGLAIAPAASELLVRMTVGSPTGPLPFSLALDARVVLFTAAVSLATIALFGLAPAFRTTRVDLATALKAGGRGAAPGSRSRPAKLLVASQVALSLVLVVVAGLFLQSLRHLLTVDVGFERERLVSVPLNPRVAGYEPADLPAVYRRLVERAEALPGVRSAALATCGIASGCRNSAGNITVSGYEPPPDEEVKVFVNLVGPHYFSTVGMQLMSGRDFDASDTAQTARVAIVNEAFARRYCASGAVGQRFGNGRLDTEIVGVVRDARVQTVREAALPTAYYSLGQSVELAGTLEVRTAGDPAPLAKQLEKALAEAEPRMPIDRVRIMSEQLERSLASERALTRLTTALGLLALALACFGLYGVMSYAVSRRTSELGVRLALGAGRGRVLWMVMRESLLLVLLGLAAGLPLVVAATRLLSTQLFGITAHDPATMIAAMAGLIAAAAAAAYLPARRASRVDPIVALRAE